MHNKETNLIIFNYTGTIQKATNELLEKSITYKLNIMKDKRLKGIVISLKDTKYDDNFDSIVMMIKKLERLSQTVNLPIALIDYSVGLYQILQKATKRSKLKLFKNFDAANLLFDSKAFKQDMCVLLYESDDANAKSLSKELVKYGYSVILAKDATEFQENMQLKKHDIVISHSTLNLGLNDSSKSKSTLTLSKKLIINLPIFMDTAVETLVTFTGLKAEKIAHSITRFNSEIENEVICAVMHFSGDIEGFFALVFPKEIALIAMESLLGEAIEESDSDTLMDGIGEFCNIITGSAKTTFLNKEIKVVFDLPKKYISLEKTKEFIGSNSGVWIDMQLANKPFYMFITK